jgi:hypothetical protein
MAAALSRGASAEDSPDAAEQLATTYRSFMIFTDQAESSIALIEF